MTSATGGSGASGGDRCPSGEKGTTPVGRRCKKSSAFYRAALRYLKKEYRECVTMGEEHLFDLEDLLRRYGSSPPNSEVSARHLLLRQQEIHQSILLSHARPVENLCVVVRIFKLHVEYSFVKFCNGLSISFN